LYFSSFSRMFHVDAPRSNAADVFTPAYLGRMGGGHLPFTGGTPMFFLAIAFQKAARKPSVFETGTTATGSITVYAPRRLPTVGT
jgi:hypothetical protein